MNSNRTPLYIIGTIIVVAVVGVIVYAVTQNGKGVSNHTHQESSQDISTVDAVQTDQIKISNFAFSPPTITVKVGTKVTWTNQDDVKHTVTTDSGAPAKVSSDLFGKGESFSFTFEKAGAYRYHCEPHPYMKGTVIVTE